MSNITALARPCILRRKAYVPGKPVEEVKRELGLGDIIKMASNENPLGTSPLALQAMIRELQENGNRYPESVPHELSRKVAQLYSVQPEQLFFDNGEDGVIVVVEHLGSFGRRDHLVERGQARRADGGTQLRGLQVGERGSSRDLRALVGEDGLGGRVVGTREVDGLLALVGDRELLQVEVPGLGSGRDGLVEGGPLPDHLVLGESQLFCDGIGDRGFEALSALRCMRYTA